MEQEGMYRLRLPEEQEQLLVDYVKSRRYSFMLVLWLTGIGAVVLLPAAIFELSNPELMDRRPRYRRSRRFSLFATFCILALSFIVSFIRGFGKDFGCNADLDCLLRQKYAFGTMTVGDKHKDTMKHPYFVSDVQGREYCCPVFLDYKKVQPGDTMHCVLLDNGKRYAFLEPAGERGGFA